MGLIMKCWIKALRIAMMMAARIAAPNPLIWKFGPINAAVIHSVMALMTNMNRPNVNKVTGNVKITKIGLTKMLRIERIRLASIAAEKPDKCMAGM
jgi:hypothetical protein